MKKYFTKIKVLQPLLVWSAIGMFAILNLISVQSAKAQYTTIPDVNFEQRLISLGIDNGAIDHQVLTSAISGITSLDVSRSSIANLTGIERFRSLTILNCSYNSLSSLNVSANSALTDLNCSNNSINTLDVSRNNALVVLNCFYNNLTALDVSANTSLITLWCFRNSLSNLNLNGAKALNSLNCGNNSLTSLDVSTNKALTDLYCGYNSLSSLNVSANTALFNLECFNNLLSTLNLSGAVALNNLECDYNSLNSSDISTNIDLRSIQCRYNSLSSLDVSTNTALWWLNCSNNSISSINFHIFSALRFFYCSNNLLSNLDVSANKDLAWFNCSSNLLSNINVNSNTALQRFWCSNNSISSLNVSTNTAVWELVCNDNLLTSLDLSSNTALTRLQCFNNSLLKCINVSNPAAAVANSSFQKDTWASYALNCYAPLVYNYCQNAPAVPLASPFPTGHPLRWYTTAVGGRATLVNPTPSTNTDGTRVYYVSQVSNGVESARIAITVNTLGLPGTPGAITGVASQGVLVGTTTAASYSIAPVANATTYNWTVPTGVNIVSGQGTTTLTVNFNNVPSGAGIIGNLMVVAVNDLGCSTRAARILALTKALPAAPTAIRMTDAALAVPASGIATAVTNISRYIGQPTVLTLTATPVAGVTTYEWELPAGVTVLSGALPVRGGALGGNVITVNFEGVTTAGMFNFTTTSGILTHVLRIGVRSITGVGASVTSNTSLVNPTTNNTARLLTLTATAPRASSSIRMTDTMAVDPTKAITVMSTFIGTQKTLTLTATPVATANQYNWELPAGVKQLSGGNSNVITVNFADVAAGTTSLYLGVKAMNGAGGSVTSNTSLVPATNSTARLLRLSATVPGTVPAVDGQVVGLCGNETYTYSITPSLLATYYAITAPEGSIVTSKSKQSNKSNSLNTPDLDFTVSYPEKLMTTNEKPASITVAAINGVGMSKSLRTLIVTNSLHGPLKIIMSTDFDRKYIGAQVTHSNHRIKKRFNPNLQSRWTVNDGVEIVSGQGTDEIEIDYSKVLPTIKSTKVSVYVENSCGVVSLPITTTIILERTVDKTAETLTIEATEVYPNPVVSDLSIDVTASAIGSLTMTVFSLDGNLAMNSKTVALQEGNNTITENVSSLGKGVYILQLVNTSNNEIITKKLIKD